MGSTGDKPVDVYALSLQELINTEINTGSLFAGSAKEAPSAITVIERDKIELSGAKNLANLLEQHVPGMMLMTHSEGNKIGLRGDIAAENYKLLLLINGKNITNMVYEGVITEIDQWELGDIERVEVIRGPGSVTYGTGAVAGVINIITKNSSGKQATWSAGLARNDTYRSQGANVQFSGELKDWGVYAYLSLRESDGLNDPDYYQMNTRETSDIRFIGKGSSAQAGPQDFLADSLGRPQIKAHISLNHSDHFKTWIRYTQSGQVRSFDEQLYTLDDQGNERDLINGRNLETRSFALSSDYRFDLNENSALTASFTYDTQEYIRYRFDNRQEDEGSTSNVRQYAFAQDRLTASVLYDVQAFEKLSLVTGYEYSNIDVGAPWGKSSDYLWIKEGVDIISSLDTSAYLQDPSLRSRPNINNSVEVGNGLRFETNSLLLESKYALADGQALFYAHRLDFPDVSDRMFSPRLSLVSTIDEHNTLVSTLQRAQRMMPLRAQFLANQAGDSKHETLDSLELSYTNTQLANTSINLRVYYNDIHAVGFTGENLEFLNDTELFGLELTASYKLDALEINASHAFIDPIHIEMNDELKTGRARNNISFADYYYVTNRGIPLTLEGYGDGLNNWPSNISKLSISRSFLNGRLKTQMNAQIYWDYDGAYDEMHMYQRAYDTFDRSSLSPAESIEFEQQYQAFRQERELLEREDAYEFDFNLNASVSYDWSPNKNSVVNFKLFAENLFRSSKRYYVSTGSSGTLPTRLKYLDKPRMFGASIQMSFQ